jgi:hypothetical protein
MPANTSAAIPRSPSHPTAIWAAFARQSQWKSWFLTASFALNFLLALAAMGFAQRPPDVVLVDSSSGKSTYVGRPAGNEALLAFLQQQRGLPSDVTVTAFTRGFLISFLAVNSSTVEASWGDALSEMAAPLRERMAREAAAQKLLETYKLAGIRTELSFRDVVLLERHQDLFLVRVHLLRKKESLLSGSPLGEDALEVELVEHVVRRSAAHPDGLEIAEYRNRVLPPASPGAAQTTGGAP